MVAILQWGWSSRGELEGLRDCPEFLQNVPGIPRDVPDFLVISSEFSLKTCDPSFRYSDAQYGTKTVKKYEVEKTYTSGCWDMSTNGIQLESNNWLREAVLAKIEPETDNHYPSTFTSIWWLARNPTAADDIHVLIEEVTGRSLLVCLAHWIPNKERIA